MKKKRYRIPLAVNNRSALFMHTCIHTYTHVQLKIVGCVCVHACMEGNHILLKQRFQKKKKRDIHNVRTAKLTTHGKHAEEASLSFVVVP